jgi:opacity protein-like surface antigen
MFLLSIILFIAFSFSSALADSPDYSRKFAFSLAVGRNKPILGNKFDDRADGENVFGFYGRYQFGRSSGIQFGYTRYDWSHSPTAARIYDLVYLHRMHPREYWTPVWGLGLGLVDIAHYNVDEDLKIGLKARVGAEYSLSPNMILDAVIDFQYVGKMPGEKHDMKIGDIYALAPQLILSYFFGSF